MRSKVLEKSKSGDAAEQILRRKESHTHRGAEVSALAHRARDAQDDSWKMLGDTDGDDVAKLIIETEAVIEAIKNGEMDGEYFEF